jgi:hypothetical protein
MHSPALSDEQAVTTLTCGSTKSWLMDSQILCYRCTETTRSAVDVCVNDLRAELQAWESGLPLRLLLDIRGENAIVSAYALHRCRELTRLRPDITGKVAVIAANTLNAQIVAMALRGLPNEYRRRLVFTNEPEAVAWLLQEDKISFRV